MNLKPPERDGNQKASRHEFAEEGDERSEFMVDDGDAARDPFFGRNTALVLPRCVAARLSTTVVEERIPTCEPERAPPLRIIEAIAVQDARELVDSDCTHDSSRVKTSAEDRLCKGVGMVNISRTINVL